ncbi:MAG: hypothetical protein ACRC6I_06955 [Paracoccaceae bacterium]
MTMRLPIALPLLAALALSACVGSGKPTPNTFTDIGPGAAAADAATASLLFARICADTAPSLSAARSELAALPFRQAPDTGTYFHTQLDLSFKLRTEGGQNICSMVFGTTDDPQSAALLLAAAGSGSQANIRIAPPTQRGARIYLAAFAVSN